MAIKSKALPIFFRGKSFRCLKYDRLNPHSRPVDEALKKIEGCLEKIGVSRFANISGFDRIGIPAYNAVRPDLEGSSVQHGKGLTPEAAKVSAAMEAIERYHGANVNLPSFRLSYRELAKNYHTIPVDQLPLAKHSLFNVNLPERWLTGWDIVNQREVALPLAVVRLSKIAEPGELDSFQVSSNGLAAGTDFVEAVCQALLEVIERDAITCHIMAIQAAGAVFPLKRVRLETIEEPDVKAVLAKIEAARVTPYLYDCEVDTMVPTYKCYLIDQVLPHKGVCYGMGASLDPAVAMMRAITEAVQARAVFSAGSRDVFFHDQFILNHIYGNRNVFEMIEREEPVEIDAPKKSEATSSFEGDIRVCIEKLARVGLNQVIVVDLTRPDWGGIPVVKVVVPGLEGYMFWHYTPGERARAYLGGKQV
jgi:ribosomal protein S12 methylthiotransferase accessory factor